MGIVNGIGSALIGAGKIGIGFVNAGAKGFVSASGIVGNGLLRGFSTVGKATSSVSKTVGRPLVAPFNSTDNAKRTVGNYLETMRDIGTTIVGKNADGHMRITNRGLAIIGGIMTATKVNDSWFEAKTTTMGEVDRQPVRPTPNYNPREYEMHPSKRISYDSGGATGDLVFALHRNR